MRLRMPFVIALVIALAVTILAIVIDYWPYDKRAMSIVTMPSLAVDTPKAGLAAYEGRVMDLRHLLASGVDVEGVGSDKRSPLLLAAAGSQMEAVAVLLQAGAKPNTLDGGGMTPLHWATVRGNSDIVDALLAHGSRVNEQREDGATPLILAAIYGQSEIVTLLLNAGGDPAIRDSDGNDTQAWARRNHRSEILGKLERHAPK